MSLRGLSTEDLFDRAVKGERRSLGRLLSLVERGGAVADDIAELAHNVSGSAQVVGITGAPGAGKSTLTGQLTRLLHDRDLKPAVLAVDPSSPLTGGAILGDRIRMDDLAGDVAFIRSMATRGHSGGLSVAVPGAVRLFDAAGYDPIIIETVGVGQVEVDVAATADTTVVVVTPGWGDAVQANKAGLLEVADVFVVNKADRPGANDARRDLDLMLDLGHLSAQHDESNFRPPIVMTTATEGIGASDVWDAVETHREHLATTDQLTARRRRRLSAEVQSRLEQLLATRASTVMNSGRGQNLLARADEHELSPAEAAQMLIEQILET